MEEPTRDLVVVVRAPNQEMNDFRVECPSSWTVLRLKEHLQGTYQGNPVPSDQKLIYSGQLLEDASILKDVLRHESLPASQYIVHLVCRPPKGTTEPKRVQSNTTTNNTTPNASSTQFNTGTSNDQQSTLRYRIPTIQYEASSHASAYTAHILAMQNMYAQYYHQLIAYQNANAQGGYPQVTSYVFNPSQFTAQQQQQQATNINNNNLDNNNVNANNAAANDNNNNNDEDNENLRDWLDYIYVIIRVGIFGMIVYFYSSIERFMFVTLIGVMVYLYQQGRVGIREQAPINPVPAPAPPVNEEAQNIEVERLQAAMDGAEPRLPGDTGVRANTDIPQSPILTAVNVLKAFVISLIPETPN